MNRPDTSLWAAARRHGLLRLLVATLAYAGLVWLGLVGLLA